MPASAPPAVPTACSCSLPPAFNKPVKPHLYADVDALPSLLRQRTITTRLGPYRDPLTAEDPLPPPGDIRLSWSLWLESYYGMFHPDCWILLTHDHEAQKTYFHALRTWYYLREAASVKAEELEVVAVDMKTTYEDIRRLLTKLYYLHTVRSKFINYYRSLFPDLSDRDIIIRFTSMEGFSGSKVAQHSVWPLPCPVPPRPVPPVTSSLTFISALDNSDLFPYTVPNGASDCKLEAKMKHPRDIVRQMEDGGPPPPPYEQSAPPSL
ncbi:hypothetical protein JCM10207_002302 [Rhodosporidiobolus poonsookiae]